MSRSKLLNHVKALQEEVGILTNKLQNQHIEVECFYLDSAIRVLNERIIECQKELEASIPQ
tara:strand:+ start:4396 stop:4578 length:183 start_codon:yes stop_codon:yes gene_type:complete